MRLPLPSTMSLLLRPRKFSIARLRFDSVWDYNSNSKVSNWNTERGSCNRATAARITALEFINAQDTTMLLVGSEDGSVRVWSNYMYSLPNHEPSLITAWQALPELSAASCKSTSSLSEYRFLRFGRPLQYAKFTTIVRR